MKIEYVGHASLFIDTGDVKIVTDPWFAGPAYCNQWHVFPKPVNVNLLSESQVVLLSHGHEDHLHESSLNQLPKSAQVFYPYTWYGGTTEFLKSMGYSAVTEVVPEKRFQLSPETFVTYIVNGMDSIIVIESKGQVLLNINDALHSYPPKIIDLFIQSIKVRWPRIDTLFCGFGGASYFPNTIHCTGKDDVQIGEAREQLFAHNFCRIVDALKPQVAVPFAADFALLGPGQRWINDVRFPRTRLPEYFSQVFNPGPDSGRIQIMYSGDVLDDNVFLEKSPYWDSVRKDRLHNLVDEQYASEIAELKNTKWISAEEADVLEREMLENVRRRAVLFEASVLASLVFCVKVTDLKDRPYLNVRFENGKSVIQRSDTISPVAILQIETTSQLLRYSFASDWGGDAITIGYGCDIRVFDQATVAAGLDTVCVRLLTRQPQASRHWRVAPIRLVKHLVTSPTTRTWVVKSFLGRSDDYSDKKTNDIMREWLFRSKCEVCRACDLPLLDETFAAKI